MRRFSSKSQTGSNVAETEGLDNNLPEGETKGDLNTDAAYTVVKTEVSSIGDYSTFTGLEAQHEFDTECTSSTKTETSESESPLFTRISHGEKVAVSDSMKSTLDHIMPLVECCDAPQSKVFQQNRTLTLQKKLRSVSKRNSRKRPAESIDRKRNKRGQKVKLNHIKILSESDIKVEAGEEATETLIQIQKPSKVKVKIKKTEGEEGLFCSFCNRTFKNKASIDKHILDSKCLLKCDVCDKVFAYQNKQNLKKHLKRHGEQNDYKCEDCNKQFFDKYKLLQHRQTIHCEDRQYKCENCCKTFTAESNLILHKATNHSVEGKYPCPNCPKVYERAERLGEHLKFIHLIGEDRLLPCSYCGNVYTARYLPVHEKLTHKKTKDFHCELCPASFVNGVELTYHMRRHTKSYSEYCETCGKGCYTRTELKNHLRIHSGEKPFSCTLCEYRCALKTNLTKHMKIHNKG